MHLDKITETIRNFSGIRDKREIPIINNFFYPKSKTNGLDEDAVIIKTGKNYWVIACDAIQQKFCQAYPEFAGRSAVLASVNDVAAMGGRPILIVNSVGAKNESSLGDIFKGMSEAASLFGLNISGGHLLPIGTNNCISVTVIGRAKAPLLSTTLKPGDRLLMVCDHKGQRPMASRFAWNSTFDKTSRQIRSRYSAIRNIAEEGFFSAGKDISNAGIIGTASIMLESSGMGAVIDLDAITIPESIPPVDWYRSFLSFGFIFGLKEKDIADVMKRIRRQGLRPEIIGTVCNNKKVILKQNSQSSILFNWKRDWILKKPPKQK